jgi:hypothetical protein
MRTGGGRTLKKVVRKVQGPLRLFAVDFQARVSTADLRGYIKVSRNVVL